MATKWCNHGSYPAYAATPTWGVCQDGDGEAIGLAVSAIAVIDLTSAIFDPAFTSTFSVFGCTAIAVTAAANSGANAQYSGTLTTMINNIVAAINSTTSPRTIVSKPNGNWRSNNVPTTVFARRNGNSLEIMTRAGSALYNGMTVITWTNVTNATAGVLSGGVSGAWGYMINTAAIWPENIAVHGYGLLGSSVSFIAGFAGNASVAGDTIHCRSNKLITLTATPNLTPTLRGTRLAPVEIRIDDGTIWPADGSTPVFEMRANAASGTVAVFLASNQTTGILSIKAKPYSNGTYGFRIGTQSGSSSYGLRVDVGSGLFIEGMDFNTTPGSGNYCTLQVLGLSSDFGGRIANSRVRHSANQPFFTAISNSSRGSIDMIGVDFDNTGAASPNSAAFAFDGPNAQGLEVFAENCKFTGFPTNSRLFANGLTVSLQTPYRLHFSNTTWGNVGWRGPIAGVPLNLAQRMSKLASAVSQFGTRDFFIDIPNGYVDWDSTGGYPTCNARLLDGTTPWVMKVILPRVSTYINASVPFELPRIGKFNTLADGARTLTVQLAIEQSLSPNARDISMVVVYEDTAGVRRVVDSYDTDGAALATSTATWSSESGGQVTLFPGPTLHNKREISLTTPTAIKTGTEIGIFVRFNFSVSNTTQTIFVDPEVRMV